MQQTFWELQAWGGGGSHLIALRDRSEEIKEEPGHIGGFATKKQSEWGIKVSHYYCVTINFLFHTR